MSPRKRKPSKKILEAEEDNKAVDEALNKKTVPAKPEPKPATPKAVASKPSTPKAATPTTAGTKPGSSKPAAAKSGNKKNTSQKVYEAQHKKTNKVAFLHRED